ncbi:bromodomain-containing protein 4-like [Coccinella septempunctata]|uniref:bromodomain-containing protein 4-like n=1 Tax=Coccinella septempunctata TaxID=41139 RepID=UPI001D06CC10|nr:bromodomain-containing protein 4-like [Coccinella septempunctata]
MGSRVNKPTMTLGVNDSTINMICIILQCFSTLVRCDATLDEQNSLNNLNPVNDHENNEENEKERDHDKRTIFNSEVDNYGWAKHVGVHPSGFKYILGIGPVDLKYVPVIRNPFKLNRPKWPPKVFKPFRPVKPSHNHVFKPARPVVVNHGIGVRPLGPVFRPVVPLVRPALPFGKPVMFRPVAPPAPQWPNKSWQQDEWKQKPASPKPVVGLTPVNLIPIQPVVKPVPPPQAVPVVPLQPANPVVSVQPVHPPVVPLQPINPVVQVQPAPQPVVPYPTTISTDPWVPLVKPAYPLVPQQPLLEVTKPNLPVLPLGASFPSPILQQAQPGPGVVLPKPQLIHQNTAPVVEFHGNHHHHFISPNGYINFHKLASIQPQYAPQFTQVLPQNAQIFPTGVQFQQNPQILPFDAGQPIPNVPQFQHNVPQVTQVQQLPRPEQQYVPQVTQVQQLPRPEQQYYPQVTPVQQLPRPEQQYFPQVTQFQPQQEQQYVSQVTQFQQLPGQEQQVTQIQQFVNQGQQGFEEQYQPSPAHGQLPLEGESQQQQNLQNQFLSNSQSNFFFQGQDQQYVPDNDLQQQQFQSSNSIQPGQTDVQTPLYLPPHNTYNPQVETFNNAFSSQFVSNPDNGLRPSATLEAPYNNFGYNRREDVGEDAEEDSTGGSI